MRSVRTEIITENSYRNNTGNFSFQLIVKVQQFGICLFSFIRLLQSWLCGARVQWSDATYTSFIHFWLNHLRWPINDRRCNGVGFCFYINFLFSSLIVCWRFLRAIAEYLVDLPSNQWFNWNILHRSNRTLTRTQPLHRKDCVID